MREWSPDLQVAEANRCWREEEDGIIDDCTVIVALLNIVPASSLAKNSLANRPHISKAMKEVAKKTSNAMKPQTLLKTSNPMSKVQLSQEQE